MSALLDWLDQRTGYRKITREALFENIPGGSRWRYVWGSTLTFALLVQFITGIFLWMGYSPSSLTAWESVYYIQHEMAGGWLLRGIHHYTAQLMTILLVLHLMQVVIDGAYKAPREVNFWFGLILLQLVLALSLTGYLLPWDQKGYWATKVATNLLAMVPFIGPDLQKLVIGGSDYGHHTLTRFFALHAGVLPALVVALVVGHIYLFRRHGITAKEPGKKPDAHFWPDQVLKDAVACLAVLATVVFLIVRPRLFGGGELGPDLGAPADPSEPFSAARPDWYFLFLFQFLKYFPGHMEIIGAIVIPGIAMGILFVMPFLGRWKLGHRFNLGFLWVMLAGAGLLTWLALADDRRDPEYARAVEDARIQAQRVKALAGSHTGIPETGAAALLRNDSFVQGPKLFARNCASCHFHGGHNLSATPEDPPSAADLKGFASREWIAGLLDPEQIGEPHYFGGTKFNNGRMARFVRRDVPKYSDEEKEQLNKIIAAISAEAQLPSQRAVDERDATLIAEGRLLFPEFACADCHRFHSDDEDATAPELTGYGSREWLFGMIADPTHPNYYGARNDRMPSFEKEEILSRREIEMLVEWLRGEWYDPANEVVQEGAMPPTTQTTAEALLRQAP